MESIDFILNSPHKAETFIIVIAAMLSMKLFINLWDFFKEKFGLETKGMRREKMQIDQINTLKSEMNDIKEEIDEVRKYSEEAKINRDDFKEKTGIALEEIRRDMLDEKIERYRSSLLEFAACLKIYNYNQESYNHIFDLYSKYEKLIKDNNLVNGYVEISMEFIRKRYAEQLQNGFKDIE